MEFFAARAIVDLDGFAHTEPRLRALGERGDIIKRLHKSLAKDGASRATSSWALEGERHGEPVIGRLADDEHTTREWLDWANCVEDRSAPGG